MPDDPGQPIPVAEQLPKRKRGRPKGSKNRLPRPKYSYNTSGLMKGDENKQKAIAAREIRHKRREEALLTREGVIQCIREIGADEKESAGTRMAAFKALIDASPSDSDAKVPASVRAWIDEVYERRLKAETPGKS